MRYALLALAACSTPPTVTIGVATNPLAFAFRPDGGAWQQASLLATSERSSIFEVPQQDGTLAVACTKTDGTFQVEELMLTASDFDGELYSPLLPWPQLDCSPPSTLPRVQVIGSMYEGGEIYIGDEVASGANEWEFSAAVTQGAHDIVAFDPDYTTVFIDHGVTVDSPTVLPTVELANGLTTSPVSFNAGFSYQSVDTLLTTANGTTVDLAFEALYIPSEALQPGDQEVFRLVVTPDDGSVASDEIYAVPTAEGSAIDVSPEDPPFGAAFSASAIAVDLDAVGLPTGSVDLRLQYAAGSGSLAVTATSAWLYEHDKATTIAFDETVPGFRWQLEPSASRRALTISARSPATLSLGTLYAEP